MTLFQSFNFCSISCFARFQFPLKFGNCFLRNQQIYIGTGFKQFEPCARSRRQRRWSLFINADLKYVYSNKYLRCVIITKRVTGRIAGTFRFPSLKFRSEIRVNDTRTSSKWFGIPFISSSVSSSELNAYASSFWCFSNSSTAFIHAALLLGCKINKGKINQNLFLQKLLPPYHQSLDINIDRPCKGFVHNQPVMCGSKKTDIVKITIDFENLIQNKWWNDVI